MIINPGIVLAHSADAALICQTHTHGVVPVFGTVSGQFGTCKPQACQHTRYAIIATDHNKERIIQQRLTPDIDSNRIARRHLMWFRFRRIIIIRCVIGATRR